MHDANYRDIPLYRRDGSVRDWTVVDEADYAELSVHRWCRNSNGYAVRSVGVLMHREILGLVKGDGREADHINRDKLDNRRSNLRVVTRAENCLNLSRRTQGSSRYRGVYWDSSRRRWRARAKVDTRFTHLGYFKDEDAAGEAVREFWHRRGIEL